MRTTPDGHPTFEAGPHSAHRGARLSLHGYTEDGHAESEQCRGKRHPFGDNVPFPIHDDLDERGHHAVRADRGGRTRIGENGLGSIGASRRRMAAAMSSAVPSAVVMPSPS